MNLEKLTLAQRIQRLNEGETAHPEYTPLALRAMGELPLMTYLATMEHSQEKLRELIGNIDHCTFQRASLRIQNLWQHDPERGADAVWYLAIPLINFERRGGKAF